jgi:hypothetical protein
MPRRSANLPLDAGIREHGYAGDLDLATLAALVTADRGPRPPSLPRFAPPHEIAFFAANPHGTDPLALAQECADIQRELKRARFRDDFRFTSCWAVTVDDLVRQLDELDPTVIHLSGHADAAGVVLEDEHGAPMPVPPRALAGLIGEVARRARVVVLNACSTTAHAFALRANIDAVVAMDGEIGDTAARMFAVRLYGALGNRRSIGAAVAQGVATLRAKQLPDERLPRCVTRDDVDPRSIFLSSLGER